MNKDDFSPDCPGRLVPLAGGGWSFVPHPLPPAIEPDFALMKAHGGALAAIGALEAALPPEQFHPLLLAYPLLQREAVCSSRMEGTHTTPRALALFDLGPSEDEPTDPATTSTREVVNYVNAAHAGIDLLRHRKIPFSHRVIRESHRVLMEGVRDYGGRPGEYRKEQNFIGRAGEGLAGARFVPPPPREVLPAMDALEAFVHREMGPEGNLPTLLGLAMVHYQFETIHPFRDGNGRIGRLLVPLILLEKGILREPILHVSPVLERRKREYVDLMLEVSRRGAWKPWILFFLDTLRESAEESLSRARNLRQLRASYGERAAHRRASALLPRLLDHLFQQPALNVADVSKALGVGTMQANEYVRKLVALGILEEVTGWKRNRRFAAKEIFDVIFDAT